MLPGNDLYKVRIFIGRGQQITDSFLYFSFVYAGFRGLQALSRGIWQGARVQKKPYAVGVPQHRASWFFYVIWASEMAEVTLN
jgi:hypothetical protein